MANDTWHWQQYGSAWRGIGIYHMILVVPSRDPLLGKLVIPDDDPMQAYVERSELGKAVIHDLAQISQRHPEIKLLQYCLMPNHLHAILHVTAPMSQGILAVVRGFWQGVKKLSLDPTTHKVSFISRDNIRDTQVSSISRNSIRDQKEVSSVSNEVSSVCRDSIRLRFPIFTEKPFLRPMSTHGQLQSMIRYVQMNPARLATKRLKPGFFCVQHNVEINGRTYDAVGNIGVLMEQFRKPVHVRSMWVKDAAEHGYDQPLKDYKAACLDAASKGTVMVSPFISRDEQEVLHALLHDNRYIIYLSDNGFGNYFKPSDLLFDAVASGRLLILSPWTHDPNKRTITRAECVALNQMAEEISASH